MDYENFEVYVKEKGIRVKTVEVYEIIPRKIYWVYIECLDRLGDFINDIMGNEVGLDDNWCGIKIFGEKGGSLEIIDEEHYAYVLFKGKWVFFFLSLCPRGYIEGFIVNADYYYKNRIEKENRLVFERWYR